MSKVMETSLGTNVTMTNETTTEEPIPQWSIILGYIQIGIISFGFLANVGTLIVLTGSKIRKDFGGVILIILRHQAIIDSLVCVSGTLLNALPPLHGSGHPGLESFVCFVWHSQWLYWMLVWVSIYSLLLIAVDRYLAVCRPFRYQDLTERRVRFCLFAIYILAAFFTSGSALQVTIKEEKCVHGFHIEGKKGKRFMAFFAVTTWFSMFSGPATLFIILYRKVICTLRMRAASPQPGTSQLSKATAQLTKSAIVATIIFVIALGYDLNYYVLAYLGAGEYKVGTPVQKIGVLFSTFNSFVNPFVYILLMPVFRQHVKHTFFWCFLKQTDGTGPSEADTSTCKL